MRRRKITKPIKIQEQVLFVPQLQVRNMESGHKEWHTSCPRLTGCLSLRPYLYFTRFYANISSSSNVSVN